jgi:hypothetical protein
LLFGFCRLLFAFLTGFLVRRMFFAEPAVLFKFHSRRVLLFVFRHRIIAPLALAAFQRDNFSHLYIPMMIELPSIL